MRNGAVLPSLPSQLYIFGNNEGVDQMPNSDDVSLQMDSKVNDYGSSFCVDSEAFNHHSQLGDGCFVIPPHSLVNHQPGPSSLTITKRINSPCSRVDYQTLMPSYENNPQQSMLLSKKFTIPQFEAGFQAIPTASKRPLEANDILPKKALKEGKKNKKVVCSDTQWHHQVNEKPMEIQGFKLQVPVRRSQKLSDKITALQKLVSPYGKTDTASVLQEASIYIKLLQERIRNMYEMRSSSPINLRSLNPQKIEEKQLDLRSRGLCLVPTSITQKLTKEDRVDHHAVSRKPITPRSF